MYSQNIHQNIPTHPPSQLLNPSCIVSDDLLTAILVLSISVERTKGLNALYKTCTHCVTPPMINSTHEAAKQVKLISVAL